MTNLREHNLQIWLKIYRLFLSFALFCSETWVKVTAESRQAEVLKGQWMGVCGGWGWGVSVQCQTHFSAAARAAKIFRGGFLPRILVWEHSIPYSSPIPRPPRELKTEGRITPCSCTKNTKNSAGITPQTLSCRIVSLLTCDCYARSFIHSLLSF